MEKNILGGVHELLKNLTVGVAESNALYDAATVGDVSALHELLEKEPFLLSRVTYTTTCLYKTTPLHIAVMNGHVDFVREILKINAMLVQELDTQQSSALHVASAKGNLEIVKELLKFEPEMCFSRDCQGRNPLHLAVMMGHVEVVKELVERSPFAAREKLDGGVTVLHLCVKYNQLEVLKIMGKSLRDQLNVKDDGGDTILHMAVRGKQDKAIKILVRIKGIDVNAKDSKGEKAFDISKQLPIEIRNLLRPPLLSSFHKAHTKPWLSQKRDAIMVVAVLLATMTFQAGLNPPGGVWQDSPGTEIPGLNPPGGVWQNSSGTEIPGLNPPGGVWQNSTKTRTPGESVMAETYSDYYKSFVRFNTIGFISSLSTIMLLISGLPFRRRLFMWILMVIMWVTLSSTVVTYFVSIEAISPGTVIWTTVGEVEGIGILVWGCVLAILVVGNIVRLLYKGLKKTGFKLQVLFHRFKKMIQVNRGTYGQQDTTTTSV